MNDLISKYAPELALPPYPGNFTTPEPQAGLQAPEALYDDQGNPYNWIQDQGGPRQYLIPEGRAAFAAPPTPGLRAEPIPLRGRLPVEPYTPPSATPIQGLRGRTQEPTPVRPPNSGPRAVAPIPPASPNDRQVRPPSPFPNPRGRPMLPSPMESNTPQNTAPRATATIPPEQSASRSANVSDGSFGNSLGDLLRESGFDIGGFLERMRTQREAAGATPTGTQYGRQPNRNASPTLPMRPPQNSPGQMPQDSGMTGVFDVSTPQGLADFNRRMGLNLSDQVRTRQEQQSLYNRGITNAEYSWHEHGRSVDIRPRDIGGLTGQDAVNEVQRRLQAAGYPPMRVIWESGRGRGQGTGAHIHIEPLQSVRTAPQ